MAQYKGAASEAGRAMHLMKKREKQREQMEQMKQRIAEENIMKSNIDKKFSAHYDAVEAELKSSTVGLVTLNDMKAKQEALVKEREKQLAKKEQSKELQLKLEKLREKERKKEAKRKISSLSFTLEEEEDAGDEEDEVAVYEEELEREGLRNKGSRCPGRGACDAVDSLFLFAPEVSTKKRKLGKNPDVDTSFLPDRDREEEENRLREELRQEWEAKQEKIKSEEIEITFSYWDGSGHRRTVKVGRVGLAPRSPGAPLEGMKKGNTMQQFLQKALEILRKDFSELRSGCRRRTPGSAPRDSHQDAQPGHCASEAGNSGRGAGVEGGGVLGSRALQRASGAFGAAAQTAARRLCAGFLRLAAPLGPTVLPFSLRSAGVEQLMYIKEDLIIPHHHSFYDFIVTKARGKSGKCARQPCPFPSTSGPSAAGRPDSSSLPAGPLFNFDVHDDVRLLSDATVEKDESHAGKVVLRSWYEKNKHIFPASRWEPYDPEKKWDKYTVSGSPGVARAGGTGASLAAGWPPKEQP
ncbi:unnamed protein product [Nyctereutes procyonoides]|uniref:(raccoon dog) hypothetical protein n=1 Tax=Nyctereutes procyonoides TaxID=34880 RepID=A0A811Z1Q7_NYCPR|nr:unnamed protein product [Nyctereutes procyonoides]